MRRSKPLAPFALLALIVFLAFPLRAEEPASAPSAPPAKMTLTIDGKPILPTNGTVAGVWFFADFDGEKQSQLLLLGHENAGPDGKPNYRLAADLAPGEKVELTVPAAAGKEITFDSYPAPRKTAVSASVADGLSKLTLFWTGPADNIVISRPLFPVKSDPTSLSVTLAGFRAGGEPVSLDPQRRVIDVNPIAVSPDMTPYLTDTLIEWDWRMQDGIETPREPRTFRQAIEKRLPQIRAMLADLAENAETDGEETLFASFEEECTVLSGRLDELNADPNTADTYYQDLWRELHRLRRRATLANPKFNTGPLVFAKHVPTVASHQLTQSYGFLTRPGGGIFVLDEPGKSMNVRCLTAGFPNGGFLYPSVSYDGKSILFSFCAAERAPDKWSFPDTWGRQYQHIWRMNADGSDPVQLTDGGFDDFAPRELPDGKIIFSSTRRGGFHRCGMGPCPVFTLAVAGADGSDPHPISVHETHEWTPDVMNDGRVIYTRWDYVDRDAVYYQNLWTTRPDGTDVRIYYGNNTFNPNGVWEPKSIPGSSKIMAIGGPHHGMSAGSVMLLDNSRGVDGPEAVTRLTPEVLYPEGEVPLPYGRQGTDFNRFDEVYSGGWDANRSDRPADRVTDQPEEQRRWPVHVFKAPFPLSETYFIASYSFDTLIGEIGSNIPNQFGIYFCDAFGTRELVYRDPNISSVWAMPLAPRPAQPKYISTLPEPAEPDGSLKPAQFFIQNVYESWPFDIPEKIKSLRIVQVLPKTTPHANSPMVGAANASPGKQVLGTVPVEEDGSAQFVVPARTPFLIQALGEDGQMVQGMRSLIYGQPGETVSCTGCHEDRLAAVPATPAATIASRKTEPQRLIPGPSGSKPLSYPILVQPVLDRLCTDCHGDDDPAGGICLTGTPDGRFSKSYNALIPYVSFTYWGAPDGNSEPLTTPYLFGTRQSKLIKMLEEGHHEAELTDDDRDRLNTWIDGGNALFYGTFKPEDQERQQRGEEIEGPEMQ